MRAYFDTLWMHALAAFKDAVENPTWRDRPMQATDSAVRREIVVDATRERAFEVFTQGFDGWWPRSHHIGAAEMQRAAIDPEAGRWYEIGVDGSRCDWGAILVFEPPSRLVLEWRIGGR